MQEFVSTINSKFFTNKETKKLTKIIPKLDNSKAELENMDKKIYYDRNEYIDSESNSNNCTSYPDLELGFGPSINSNYIYNVIDKKLDIISNSLSKIVSGFESGIIDIDTTQVKLSKLKDDLETLIYMYKPLPQDTKIRISILRKRIKNGLEIYCYKV